MLILMICAKLQVKHNSLHTIPLMVVFPYVEYRKTGGTLQTGDHSPPLHLGCLLLHGSICFVASRKW